MRWKCTIAYDGTDYEGWQAQPSGKTIQDFIERRLEVLMGKRTRIYGSGRTDSGVHARGQVFHFDADWPHGADALIRALRIGHPDSMQVYAAEQVTDDFHARYSAVGKRYTYSFFEGYADPFETRFCWSLENRRLDVDAMNAGARHLIGKHDFSSFTANPRDNREDQPVKDLRRLEVLREGARVQLVTEADGYLFRMVRSLAGCLADVGIGKLSPDALVGILGARRRTNYVQTAPARGLCLERVFY